MLGAAAMKRYLTILCANFAIAMLVGINASASLIRGCVSEGQCQTSVWDWALAIGAAIAAVICGGLAMYTWRHRPKLVTQHIMIPASRNPKVEIGPAEPEASDNAVDAAMSARLARMVSAAQVTNDGETAVQVDTFDPEESDRPAEDADYGDNLGKGGLCDVDPESGSVEPHWEPDQPSIDSESTEEDALQPVAFDEPVRTTDPFSPAMTMMTALLEPEPAPDAEGELDWLFEDSFPGAPARLHRGTGFPWTLAGIDHVCVGVSRLGHRLVGTDFPAEAAAWRQVVASLPRQQRLAPQDGAAFEDWVNDLLDICGPDGVDMVVDSLHELGVEAATDPAIAAALPMPLVGLAQRSPPAMSARFMK